VSRHWKESDHVYWILMIAAILFEVAGTTCMKLSILKIVAIGLIVLGVVGLNLQMNPEEH
jgi:multidrug transporter EmrE-like cation transporter